jgi:hypothetical protein
MWGTLGFVLGMDPNGFVSGWIGTGLVLGWFWVRFGVDLSGIF